LVFLLCLGIVASRVLGRCRCVRWYRSGFCREKKQQIIYFQVTQQLPMNSERETRNLKYIRDNYEKIVLTAN